jgi:hypothetical protein
MKMFVLYLLAEDSREYTIPARSKRNRLATMYSNESVWMVPGTLSATDVPAITHDFKASAVRCASSN